MQLSNLFNKKSINLDRRILTCLEKCVKAVMHGAHLSLTSIGRKIGESNSTEKHSIKRVDRLLNNKSLSLQNKTFYEILARKFSFHSKVILLVDWTTIYDYSHVLLRASCSFGGRAFTVYEEVHPKGSMNNHAIHVQFLENLKSILPKNKEVIICTDAGFKVPWFKAVEKLDWFWLSRARGTVKYQSNGNHNWEYLNNIHAGATAEPKDVSGLKLSKSHKFACRCVIVKGKRTHPINKVERKRPNCGSYLQHSKSNKEPWVLVSNLPTTEYKKEDLVDIYSLRMTIEEAFRDTKNEYYGLGIKRSRSRSVERLEVLILIGLLAQWSLYVIGYAAEKMEMHYQYQSNSIKNRRVLSFCFLAKRILKTIPNLLNRSEFKRHLDELIIKTDLVNCGDS